MGPPPPAESTALLALMLLQDARRDARLDEIGDLVTLERQDRSRWDQEQIEEALPLVDEALGGGPSAFALQAAIAALHCQAARPEDTDWPQILRLYNLLERVQPSPVVSLNRAVAVAMVEGPRPGARSGRRAGAHRRTRRLPPAARHPRGSFASLGDFSGCRGQLRARPGAREQQ